MKLNCVFSPFKQSVHWIRGTYQKYNHFKYPCMLKRLLWYGCSCYNAWNPCGNVTLRIAHWRKQTWTKIGTELLWRVSSYPDSKVHGANMGPIWGRQDPGGSHVGPMNSVVWVRFNILKSKQNGPHLPLTFSYSFSWQKSVAFCFKFQWNFILKVNTKKNRYCCR